MPACGYGALDMRKHVFDMCMAGVFPQALADVPEEALAAAWRMHGKAVDRLMELRRRGEPLLPSIPIEEVMRVLLQVVFSAFESGVYINKAKFNHRCPVHQDALVAK